MAFPIMNQDTEAVKEVVQNIVAHSVGEEGKRKEVNIKDELYLSGLSKLVPKCLRRNLIIRD